MRAFTLSFILLFWGSYIASEPAMTQSCDEPCSNENCTAPHFGTCCHKKNIARDSQNTNQSSSDYMEHNRKFNSSLAVDGNTNTTFTNFSCTHTNPYLPNPWWMINLEYEYNISEIKLYLRNNNAPRYNGLRVEVNSSECFRLNKTFSEDDDDTPPDDQIQHIHCSPPIPGSLVRVSVNSKILTLCEVQIFVCDPGWYGEECDKHCNCRNSTDCDKKNGWCRDGCQAGKQGDGCQCDCEDGVYGVDCNESCGHCLEGTVCDKANGTCHSGCEKGYKEPLCQDCEDGMYGVDCESCGHCLEGTVCDKTNGTCHSRCEKGYKGPLCQECDEFFHESGNNCQACGLCEDNTTCSITSGKCAGNCQAGYKQPFCKEVVEEDSPNLVPIAGGVSAAIVILIIIIVVGIVILKRRSVQNKPTTVTNGVEHTKDTSVINISDTRATKRSKKHKSDAKLRMKASRKCREAEQPMECLSTTQPKHKAKKSDTKTPANQKPEDIPVEADPEVCPSDLSAGGNEYYNVIPAPITLPNLAQYIQDRIFCVGFDSEFKLLPYGIQDNNEEGKKPENKKRNRFQELHPYDHSRVVLKPEHDAEWDYINASYINGYMGTKTFIAAQGPKPFTVDDFWRMIWQQRVTMVVMVTRLTELTKKKCEQYWPDDKEMREFGNIRVHHEYSTVRRDCTIRTFNVKHSVHASESREITQLHFTSWPDHDVPSAQALVSFWKQFRRLHQEQDTGPVLVHCSAGVGRTGTFIALDRLFDEAEREEKVNVFNCVNQMRKARMNMVQTVSQYGFLHEVVLEAVQSRNTFYTSTEFHLKFGTGDSFTDDQESEIQRQFEKLNTLRKIFTDKQVSDAKLPENISKNRDENILPENKSKPYLMTPVKGRTQYINAVVLPYHVRHSAIIATQTPLPDTVVDFWRLVYDHEILNVICLEGYEILYSSEEAIVESGPFQISSLDQRRSISSQTKIILTKLEQPDESRQITVYKPSCERPSDLVEFVNEMETRGIFGQGQLLVHCNNGSDLCGLFCGVLNIITRLRLDREVDIFLDIRELQTIRPSFIHSLDQYRFCFEAVKEYERSTSIYANV